MLVSTLTTSCTRTSDKYSYWHDQDGQRRSVMKVITERQFAPQSIPVKVELKHWIKWLYFSCFWNMFVWLNLKFKWFGWKIMYFRHFCHKITTIFEEAHMWHIHVVTLFLVDLLIPVYFSLIFSWLKADSVSHLRMAPTPFLAFILLRFCLCCCVT